MGAAPSIFTEQEMEDYLDLTYFTKKEIHLCFQKFRDLAPKAVDRDRGVRIPAELIMASTELKVNPFSDRIVKVFSTATNEYQVGDMVFEDYLDMMSAFSDDAPVSLKAEYAFKIFDFDEDDMIGQDDMEEIIERLLGPEEMATSEIKQLIQNLLEEVDLDDDGGLSYSEFEHIVAKSADFVQAFKMRL